MASSTQDSPALMVVDLNGSPAPASSHVQSGGFPHANLINVNSKKLQDDLEMLGRVIKQHEDNIKSLKSQRNNLDESISDMKVALGKLQSSLSVTENQESEGVQSKEKAVEQILQHEKSAASIVCQLKYHCGTQDSHLIMTKDVLGVVANLGKVEDYNLSGLLSEYVGLGTMLATVCRTTEGVGALETYDVKNCINPCSGLHGLGNSIGKPLDGRFIVICLESLRPYTGDFLANDPQKRLDLVKPRLQNGDFPHGFIGFAVNMIDIDYASLYYLTPGGHGLRETLFYHLFSRLQVYRTRADMLAALPCISDGAISLDGGIMRQPGVFYLGDRKDIGVRFPKSSGVSSASVTYYENEKNVREMKWKRDRVQEDIQKEETLLNHAKYSFWVKKQEMIKFIADSSLYTQYQADQFSR